MKIKSMLMILPVLVAMPLAYISPVLAADDMNTQTMQPPADTQSQNNGQDNNSDDTSAASPSTNGTNSTDEGSPDTATGDDDY